LIRILAGIEKADGGEANVDKKKLSMVFQENRLLPGVTAVGNVMSVLGKGDGQEETAMSWLDKMGIRNAGHLFPRQLSGGMQRRLSIARAMAYGGDLLILDEPFTGLDAATRKRIYPHIFDETRSERLTILVTHDRRESEAIADRLIVMGGPPLYVIEDIQLARS
jgi:NitT/TauT family transport system ATP-binding protein